MPGIMLRFDRPVPVASAKAACLTSTLLAVTVTCGTIQQVRTAHATQPSADQTQSSQYQIVLSIAADGTLAVNGHTVPDTDLERTLRAIYRDRPSKVLFLKVIGDHPRQNVESILSRAKDAGVRIIAMVPRDR